jgi:hypothetical protein
MQTSAFLVSHMLTAEDRSQVLLAVLELPGIDSLEIACDSNWLHVTHTSRVSSHDIAQVLDYAGFGS